MSDDSDYYMQDVPIPFATVKVYFDDKNRIERLRRRLQYQQKKRNPDLPHVTNEEVIYELLEFWDEHHTPRSVDVRDRKRTTGPLIE